jgi:integrase
MAVYHSALAKGHNMGHRGRGEGSIYRRADGYWVGSVEAGRTAAGGRRKARVVRKYRKDVVAALDDLRRSTSGAAIPDRGRTLEAYLGWWLDEVMAGRVTAGSLREYRTRVNRVAPVIGHVRLGKLSAAHVQHLANRLGERFPRSPRTVAYTLTTLRSALRWAVTAGLIPRNPAEGVTGPYRGQTAKLDDTLTADEAKRVLQAAEDDDLRALWWLALSYGLRLGELIGLRWPDIDFANRELTVRKAKTAAGVRTLPLVSEAERVLRAHQRHGARGVSIEGYVFVTEHGTKLYDKIVYREWNDLLRRARVQHRCRNCNSTATCSTSVRRFHSSRHTAATTLLEADIPLEVIAAVMGHSSIVVTSSIYAKVRADMQRKGLTRGLAARRL